MLKFIMFILVFLIEFIQKIGRWYVLKDRKRLELLSINQYTWIGLNGLLPQITW